MNMAELIIYLLIFISISGFALVGVDMFSKGWVSYENKYVKDAEQSLDSMYLTMPPQIIFYLSLSSGVLFGLISFIITDKLFLSMPIALCALAIPQVILKMLKAKRKRDFGFQLIEALDAMGNAMRAGLSLAQSFEMINREMPNPISQEFRLVNHEMRFGARMEDALLNLQKRMPNQDLALITTAILIAQEVGGNLSEVFSNISATVRKRHAMEDKIKALTGQGKLQGIILCLLPFAIGGFLTVFYPDMMRPMFESVLGWVLIGLICVLISLGGFFISKIVSIDV